MEGNGRPDTSDRPVNSSLRSSSDRIRLLCSVLCLPGLTLYLGCLLRHTCMGGHLCPAHGPYAIWPYMVDAIWMAFLPAVAVMCWWSNMCGRRILSVVLFYLLAANVEMITGLLPWMPFHPLAVLAGASVALVIAVGGLFAGSPALVSPSPQGESRRTKGVLLTGVAVVACVMCFAMGLHLTGKQAEQAGRRLRLGQMAVLLNAYNAVASTNGQRARVELGNEILWASQNYQRLFGMEQGSDRMERILPEIQAIADAVEREARETGNIRASAIGETVLGPDGVPMEQDRGR